MPTLMDEIAEQPRALRETVAALRTQLEAVRPFAEQLRQGTLRSVILTGMGASFNASLSAVNYLVLHGVDARAIQTSDLLYDSRPLLTPSTLLIAISQSGESIELRRLIEAGTGGAPLVGITNTPDSTLATSSAVSLTTQAGPEASVSNKTYTATLAALYLLACALAGQPLDGPSAAINAAADEIEAGLEAWIKQAGTLALDLPDNGFFMLLGRGASEASALSGALILKESAKIFTEGMTGAMFRHGPVEVIDEWVAVFIFAGSGPVGEINKQLAQYLVGIKAQTIIVGGDDTEVAGTKHIRVQTGDPWVLPILEIVPLQVLAVRLCERRGIVPGSFHFLRKVAKHE